MRYGTVFWSMVTAVAAAVAFVLALDASATIGMVLSATVGAFAFALALGRGNASSPGTIFGCTVSAISAAVGFVLAYTRDTGVSAAVGMSICAALVVFAFAFAFIKGDANRG